MVDNDLRNWNARNRQRSDDKEDNDDSDFKSQWQKLKKQQSDIKKQLGENLSEDINQTLESTFRLGTYTSYCLAWKNLIDTYGLTFLYLIYHFIRKYWFHDTKFCHFVDPNSPAFIMKDKILKGEEQRHFGYYCGFIALCGLIAIIIFMIIVVLISPFALITGWWKEFGNEITGFFGGGLSGGAGSGGNF